MVLLEQMLARRIEMSEEEKKMWVICGLCGQASREHRILHEKVINCCDGPDYPVDSKEYHRFVECMGCKSTKYVISTLDCQDYEAKEENFIVYPDAPGNTVRRKPAISSDEAIDAGGERLIPESVWKMYGETIVALNSDIRTLAGGGLRAVVEAICLDKKIMNGNLQEKIDELTKKNLLTTTQAELLHEERYLGNSALHELSTPSAQDIEDGLGIVEGLINAIYILPSKAKRLKARRNGRDNKS